MICQIVVQEEYRNAVVNLISCSLMRRSLLAYLIVDFRTGTSLVELWFWTVSRWDI
jgi:hypothetical protein